MRVEVRLFALYREQAGQDRLHLDLPEGARVKDAKEALERLFPGLSLQGGMAAVNQALAQGETPLREGDEVAFLPPVSGGQDSFGLTHEPLDLKALVERYLPLPPKLLKTLEAYLEAGSLEEAARRLHIHPNTLRYRLKRMEKVLGPLSRPETLARAHLALRARDLLVG